MTWESKYDSVEFRWAIHLTRATLSFVDYLYLRMLADSVIAASVLNAVRKLRVMQFVMWSWCCLSDRVNPAIPTLQKSYSFSPHHMITQDVPLPLKPCVRGPWRHTHTLACSANRHCVVIKERCVLSGWIGRAISTCSGTVMTSDGRHPGGLEHCFTMHFLYQPAGGTVDWVMDFLIKLFGLNRH